MPSNNQRNVQRQGKKASVETRTITATMTYDAPIPHPTIMKGYEEILPGAADRLISMVEKEQVHEQKCESKVIRDEFILNLAGLIFGFVIAICWLGSATYLLAHKMFVSGGLMGAAAVALIISQFAKQRPHRKQTKE